MAATPLANQIPRCCPPVLSFKLNNLFLLKTRFFIHPKTTSSRRISLVHASSKPQRQGADAEDNDKAAFVSQEDLNYLVKLGGGSVAGAAAIKYGSVIFPEITRPNLILALLMIFVPVVVAVLLLIKQSRVD